MVEPKTICSKCDRQILQRTADDNDGLCGVCVRGSKKSDQAHGYEVVPPDPVKLDISIDVSKMRVSDSIDWGRVEDALVMIASQYVQAFAKISHEKTFYGFAFDCNFERGEIFLCANSPTALTTLVALRKRLIPDVYGHFSDHQLEEMWRWSLVDWKFQAEGFTDAWEPIEEFLADLVPEHGPGSDWLFGSSLSDEEEYDRLFNSFQNSFMETACRSMLRLEREGALDALSRTDDFKTFVADHSDSVDESWSRLEGLRIRETEA